MRLAHVIAIPCMLLSSCKEFGASASPDDPQSRAEIFAGYSYIPLDPLPVHVFIPEQCDAEAVRPLLQDLPDNAVRIAVRQLSGKGSVGFGPAQVGTQGSSYQVVLDYINTDMENIRFKYTGGDLSKGQVPTSLERLKDQYADPGPNEIVVPIYIGIGLRLTANVTVLKGNVNLGSLGALAAAAEAEKITGSLIVQTLGITGGHVASTLPLPSELNPTTIQNAIQALGAVKASVHDKDNTVVRPRVTGIYNPLPASNPQTINQIVSGLARDWIYWTRTCPALEGGTRREGVAPVLQAPPGLPSAEGRRI